MHSLPNLKPELRHTKSLQFSIHHFSDHVHHIHSEIQIFCYNKPQTRNLLAPTYDTM